MKTGTHNNDDLLVLTRQPSNLRAARDWGGCVHLNAASGEVGGVHPDELCSRSPAVVRWDKVGLRVVKEPPAESPQVRVNLCFVTWVIRACVEKGVPNLAPWVQPCSSVLSLCISTGMCTPVRFMLRSAALEKLLSIHAELAFATRKAVHGARFIALLPICHYRVNYDQRRVRHGNTSMLGKVRMKAIFLFSARTREGSNAVLTSCKSSTLNTQVALGSETPSEPQKRVPFTSPKLLRRT